MDDHDWLSESFWYVPDAYLPALQAVNAAAPVVRTLTDQTVWHLETCRGGYITGIAATNIGQGWSYNLIVGSVTPQGAVKLSFSALGAAGSQSGQPFVIGDGVLSGRDRRTAQFVMQMTSGAAGMSVTHWAHMLPVTPDDPQWHALPGYPDTGIPSLAQLFTPIVMR